MLEKTEEYQFGIIVVTQHGTNYRASLRRVGHHHDVVLIENAATETEAFTLAKKWLDDVQVAESWRPV